MKDGLVTWKISPVYEVCDIVSIRVVEILLAPCRIHFADVQGHDYRFRVQHATRRGFRDNLVCKGPLLVFLNPWHDRLSLREGQRPSRAASSAA